MLYKRQSYTIHVFYRDATYTLSIDSAGCCTQLSMLNYVYRTSVPFLLGKDKVCAGAGVEQCRCSCCKQKDTTHYVG